MTEGQLIDLIDDLVLAALRAEISSKSFVNAEKEYNEILEVFNKEITNIGTEILENSEELAHKLHLANLVLKILNRELN